jgi:serine/threonine-protein kinase HipA
MTRLAEVMLWGTRIGAVSSANEGGPATFEYDRSFLASGIQIAPLVMPLREASYRFPGLPPETFHGLPGLLADSLPDKYGSALIDAWLASQGRTPDSFTAVERLCYVGRRAMGALEYLPAGGPDPTTGHELDIASLVALASEALADRETLVASFADGNRGQAMRDILQVGTSAGGARAKALIAYNPATEEIRSGQLDLDSGFEHWLIKLDGVANNTDKESLGDPLGYGAVEYAYSLMARDLDIVMTNCRLLNEASRHHFMTRRFDRDDTGERRHMQSLGALAHLDYNQPDVHSYEEAFGAMRRLGLRHYELEQLYRRMVFNIVGRNCDDHVKNISFLMDRTGTWALAPAYDLTYAYRESSKWTAQHQMSMNGKRQGFTLGDFIASGETAQLPRGRAKTILEQTTEVFSNWARYADEAGVPEQLADGVTAGLELSATAPAS